MRGRSGGRSMLLHAFSFSMMYFAVFRVPTPLALLLFRATTPLSWLVAPRFIVGALSRSAMKSCFTQEHGVEIFGYVLLYNNVLTGSWQLESTGICIKI